LYAACIAQGMAPDYFWQMPPAEAWWFLTAKVPTLFTQPSEADKWQRLSDLADNWTPRKKADDT